MSSPGAEPSSILSIGNFDGVHLGHHALIRTAHNRAGDTGRVTAMSFDPHPLTAIRPDLPAPERLTTFEDREELLKEAGADEVVALRPTKALLVMSPRDFIQMLVDEYGMTGMVEGPDFRFGRDRLGTIDTLRDFSRDMNFDLEILEPLEVALTDHTLVTASSTMIRWLLRRGRVRDAARLLGRRYAVRGRVVQGDARGRRIGIPTANIETDCVLPADGVYAGQARIAESGQSFAAAINIGVRPTFRNESARVCEIHLIDWDGPIGEYEWELSVSFDSFLREEMRFVGTDAVVAQIQRDIASAGTMVGMT